MVGDAAPLWLGEVCRGEGESRGRGGVGGGGWNGRWVGSCWWEGGRGLVGSACVKREGGRRVRRSRGARNAWIGWSVPLVCSVASVGVGVGGGIEKEIAS